MPSCPSNAELTSYLLGRLEEPRWTDVAEHLDRCATCNQAIDDLESQADAENDRLVQRLQDRFAQETLVSSSVFGAFAPRDRAAATHLEEPQLDQLLEPPQAPREIGRLGPYACLEVLGIGGMGVVFRAVHLQLDRVVAVKAIRAGVRGAESLERFRREARAVARLHHPYVVPIYEVGEHNGVQYYAMAYAEAGTLEQRLAQGPIPSRQAAGILARVTSALVAAHQAGLVHRDLKPSNILLDATGAPLVADFGLVKFDSDDPHLTATGNIIGTPSFMSPEQAQNTSEARAASDIYSLGAVLYASITGRPPFQSNTMIGLLQQVVESEPVAPRRLNRDIPLDLETICLKCLEKQPGRRYATAQLLADDLQRFLEDRPILARPTTSTIKLIRWCRRNRRLSAALAAALLLLLTTAVVAITGTVLVNRARLEAADNASRERYTRIRETLERKRAEAAETDARRQAAKAQQFADFLVTMFERADPLGLHPQDFESALLPRAGSRRDTIAFLEQGEELLRQNLSGSSTATARLLDIIGNAYRNLGRPERAEPLLREALKLRRKLLGPRNLQTLDSQFNLAWALADRSQYEPAARHFRAVAEARQAALGARDPTVAVAWTGYVAARLPVTESVTDLMLLLNSVAASLPKGSQNEVARSLLEYQAASHLRHKKRDYEAAENAYVALLDKLERLVGRQHFAYAMLQADYAGLLMDRARPREAERMIVPAIQTARRIFAGHPRLAKPLLEYAVQLQKRSEYRRADQLLVDAQRIAEQTDSPLLAELCFRRANGLYLAARNSEAEPLIRQALKVAEKRPPANQKQLQVTLAMILFEQAKYAEAAIELRKLGRAPSVLELLATAAGDSGDHAEYRALQAELAESKPDAGKLTRDQATLLQRLRRFTPHGAKPMRAALEQERQSRPAGHPHITDRAHSLARILMSQAEFAEARQLLDETLKFRVAQLRKDDPRIGYARFDRALLAVLEGKPQSAIEPLEQTVQSAERWSQGDAGHPRLATTRLEAGILRAACGQTDAALDLLKRAAEGFHQRLPSSHPRIWEAEQQILRVMETSGQLKARLTRLRGYAAALTAELPETAFRWAMIQAQLADALAAAGEKQEAAQRVAQALPTLTACLPVDDARLTRWQALLAR